MSQIRSNCSQPWFTKQDRMRQCVRQNEDRALSVLGNSWLMSYCRHMKNESPLASKACNCNSFTVIGEFVTTKNHCILEVSTLRGGQQRKALKGSVSTMPMVFSFSHSYHRSWLQRTSPMSQLGRHWKNKLQGFSINVIAVVDKIFEDWHDGAESRW